MSPHDPRDLEWQRRYEENDTPWDKGVAAPPLTHYLQTHAITGRILVPGCGRGHEVRALAAAHPDAFVIGLDLAPAAVSAAAHLAREANLDTSTKFLLGDFFQLAPEMIGTFDWLVEHTCFCAIEPRLRPDYVRAAGSALRAGGKFFGIFYLNPDVEAGPPFAVSQEELITLFGPHFETLDHWVPTESFPSRENREVVMILQKR